MGFSMNVCDTEEIKNEVIEAVKPEKEEVKKLKVLSDNNVEAVMNLDMDSLEDRKLILKSIDEFGLDTMQKSSQKNALLEISIKNLSKMGDEGGEVAIGLTELQRAMKDLDPSMIDFTKKDFSEGLQIQYVLILISIKKLIMLLMISWNLWKKVR